MRRRARQRAWERRARGGGARPRGLWWLHDFLAVRRGQSSSHGHPGGATPVQRATRASLWGWGGHRSFPLPEGQGKGSHRGAPPPVSCADKDTPHPATAPYARDSLERTWERPRPAAPVVGGARPPLSAGHPNPLQRVRQPRPGPQTPWLWVGPAGPRGPRRPLHGRCESSRPPRPRTRCRARPCPLILLLSNREKERGEAFSLGFLTPSRRE